MERQSKTSNAANGTTFAAHAYLDLYADAGYTILPLYGKKSLQKQWNNAEYDPFPQATDFPNNIAVILQDDDLIVDVDPRNFQGNDSFKKLIKDIGVDLRKLHAFTVKTGGGGFHFYFKKPEDFKIKKTNKAYPGIDFLSKGCFVVGAGSIHPDTRRQYTVVGGVAGAAFTAPTALLEMVKGSAAVETVDVELTDDEQARSRYFVYLNNVEPAKQGQSGDSHTFTVAAMGRDYGLSEQLTFSMMKESFNPRCEPPWSDGELHYKIKNAFNYSKNSAGALSPAADFESVILPKDDLIWDFNADGVTLVRTLRNTVNYFLWPKSDLQNMLALNSFTGDIVFVKRAPWHKKGKAHPHWTDEDAVRCKYWLCSKQHYEVSVNTIHEAAIVISGQKSFHPVREYLDSLKWDGTPRIDTWLTIYLGVADNAYTKDVGVMTLVAAVARIYSPGCQFDYMLVLEGGQGTGKSQTCHALGGQWYGDITLDPHSKDTIDVMRGKWIIEVSEMECTRRTETQALKAFISRREDRVRPAYARISKDFPRQSIFIGTTNPEAENEYLKDTTGNRRFWPVVTNKIRIQKLRDDRDQLWAEAVARYNQGERLYISSEESNKIASDEQHARRMRDPWTDKIKDWLDNDDFGGVHNIVTSTELFVDCIGGHTRNFTRRETVRISNIMQNELRWEKGQFYDERIKRSLNGYRRPDGIRNEQKL